MPVGNNRTRSRAGTCEKACRFRLAALHLGVAGVLSTVAPLGALAQSSGNQIGTVDLTQATLEELMNIQVTSVSKKEQTLDKTGAAVFVITQEDIHDSGATNIPDVLRMAPGVDVAQIDANHWAISIRGFNATYANKVLVLIDGRSVYSDSFSGIFWDQQNVPLEDIDHIEVIRGPGGTVWGANAVNGVINIITKGLPQDSWRVDQRGRRDPNRGRQPGAVWRRSRSRTAVTARLAAISISITP